MKPATKPCTILFLIVFLTVSCGPVTPIPPAIVTSTPKPIATAIPTQTATSIPAKRVSPTSFLPSSWVYTPPELGPSAFKLKPWTEGDYSFFISSMNDGSLLNSSPLFLPVFQSFYGYEYLLYTGQVNINDDLVWKIAQMSPIGVSLPGMRKDEGYFEFLVEKLLNEEKVSVDDLPTVLKSHGFSVTNTFEVKDFYGKNDEALFFDAFDENGYLNLGAIFVIRRLNGLYYVDKIKSWQWMFGLGLGRDYTFDNSVDANHNGFPEFIIEEYEGHSGQPPTGALTVWSYEWNDKLEEYRINSFVIFNTRDCNDGACDGKWEVGKTNSKGIPSFIIQEYFPTQGECPDLTTQQSYRWDGKEYPLEQSTILPPSSEKENCRIGWAEAAIRIQERGWQNDQAIQIISDALDQWPDAMDIDWGPASRDYFRLRLGIWMDLRGESGEALKLLGPLAESPFISNYPLPSQAAKAYLSQRKNNGLINACQKANETWSSVIEKRIPDPFGYEMTERARQFLGFASDRWDYGIYNFSSICSEDEAIFATARNLSKNLSPNPASWFRSVGRSVYLTKQEDFDQNGQTDWLVIAQRSKGSEFSTAWFFFGDSNKYHVFEFEETLDSLSPSLWRVIQPDEESRPIYLIQLEKALWIFRVNRDQQVESLVDDYGVTSLQIDQSKSLRLKTSVEDWDYKGEKNKDYVWDSPSQTFISSFEEYDFEGARQKVEQMIFQDRDFSSAISFMQQFIAESPREYLMTSSCDPNGCEYRPERYYPFMYYMMGLAYEMSEQPVQATRTYYFLWKNYPDSPYALMAQNKLEPISN